jgi:hypothetical protein
MNRPIAGQFSGIFKRSLHVFGREGRITLQQFIRLDAGCQIVQNHGHHNPRTFDARFIVAHGRIDGNTISPAHCIVHAIIYYPPHLILISALLRVANELLALHSRLGE